MKINNSTKKKISLDILSKYRSAMMGLAIILVIIFHYTDDCAIYAYNFTGWRYLFNRLISSAGVDIFLCLSGIGLYYSFKKDSNLRMFYKKRYVKLLIPYILICLPAIIWRYVFVESVGIIAIIKYITSLAFFENGYVWFWYIFMIGFCYLIFPCLFKIFDKEQSKLKEQISLLSIIAFILLVNVIIAIYYPDLYANINIALLRFPAFVYGVYLGKQAYYKKEVSLSNILFFIIVSLPMLILRKIKTIITIRLTIAYFVMSLFLIFILLLDKFKNYKITKIVKTCLDKVGEYTLELYLTHVIVRRIFCTYGLFTYEIGYELLMVGISIILSIILHKVSQIISKKVFKL